MAPAVRTQPVAEELHARESSPSPCQPPAKSSVNGAHHQLCVGAGGFGALAGRSRPRVGADAQHAAAAQRVLGGVEPQPPARVLAILASAATASAATAPCTAGARACFRPTPGLWATGAMPSDRRCAPSPTPESCSSRGDCNAPAQRMTSRAAVEAPQPPPTRTSMPVARVPSNSTRVTCASVSTRQVGRATALGPGRPAPHSGARRRASCRPGRRCLHGRAG